MNLRKQNVILTAKQLFASKGYSTSSIQDIIDECGISKGTFYNYFASKSEFLIAYLNTAKEEEFRRRDALIYEHDQANKDIFVKQILIRIEVMHEFTLRAIHEEAFHSEDPILKPYIIKRFIEELSWLADRLIQIYGDKSQPYASDSAILMYGMIQNLLYVWSALTRKQVNLTLLVQYVVRRMDTIIDDLMKSNDLFLHNIELTSLDKNTKNITKDKIVKNLKVLKQSFGGSDSVLQQHTEFIMEELQSPEPRIHLLFSFIQAFKKVAKRTEYENEVDLIISQLKNFLN